MRGRDAARPGRHRAGDITAGLGRVLLRLASGKIGEIEDIRVGNRLHDIAHGRVVSGTYVGFVLAHRLDEKILPLTGDPGDALAAGQVRVVANVAAILAYQGL